MVATTGTDPDTDTDTDSDSALPFFRPVGSGTEWKERAEAGVASRQEKLRKVRTGAPVPDRHDDRVEQSLFPLKEKLVETGERGPRRPEVSRPLQLVQVVERVDEEVRVHPRQPPQVVGQVTWFPVYDSQ